LYIWLGVIQSNDGSAPNALMLPPVGVSCPIAKRSQAISTICCFASASVRIP
jgi:hypothetical protein